MQLAVQVGVAWTCPKADGCGVVTQSNVCRCAYSTASRNSISACAPSHRAARGHSLLAGSRADGTNSRTTTHSHAYARRLPHTSACSSATQTIRGARHSDTCYCASCINRRRDRFQVTSADYEAHSIGGSASIATMIALFGGWAKSLNIYQIILSL